MLNILFRTFFAFFIFITHAIKADSPSLTKLDLSLLEFNVVQNGNSNRKFIWLHGDEKTAKMALEHHIRKYKGTAYFIINESREIKISDGIIDPNRIFSIEGAKKNLHKYNPYWPATKKKKILESLNSDREILFTKLFSNNGVLLVSLHNNFKGYNIKSEISNSDEVSIKKDQNPRDFYLCTNKEDFEILLRSPFNVVLQESPPKEDDGSLSWAALSNGVRYINIETRLGWLSMQKKMLKYVEENLP
tara:strand:- start:156 stop:896 length:741 start_codon:yes stop_codon:yes gene_type:complete